MEKPIDVLEEEHSHSYMSYPDDVDDGVMTSMSAVKRRRKGGNGMCVHWGTVCVPESNFKFTKCCGGLNCVCNLWNTHCRCRAKLG